MSDLEHAAQAIRPGRQQARNAFERCDALSREPMQTLITHSNIQRTFDIYANVQDRDLGLIEADLKQILPEFQSRLKPGNQIVLRGQMKSKNDAFLHLGLGLVGALVFVYPADGPELSELGRPVRRAGARCRWPSAALSEACSSPRRPFPSPR